MNDVKRVRYRVVSDEDSPGARSVIVKHAPPAAVSNPDIALDQSRVAFEFKGLEIAQQLLAHPAEGCQAREAGLVASVPTPYYYDASSATVLMQDVAYGQSSHGSLAGCCNLAEWLHRSTSGDAVDSPELTFAEIGAALGRALAQVHVLSFLRARSGTLAPADFDNRPIQATRQAVQYAPTASKLRALRSEAWSPAGSEAAPELSAAAVGIATALTAPSDAEIEAAAAVAVSTGASFLSEPGACLTHGDLWLPSVLVRWGSRALEQGRIPPLVVTGQDAIPRGAAAPVAAGPCGRAQAPQADPLSTPCKTAAGGPADTAFAAEPSRGPISLPGSALQLFLIDWEFCHWGNPAQDLGHFAAHCQMVASAADLRAATTVPAVCPDPASSEGACASATAAPPDAPSSSAPAGAATHGREKALACAARALLSNFLAIYGRTCEQLLLCCPSSRASSESVGSSASSPTSALGDWTAQWAALRVCQRAKAHAACEVLARLTTFRDSLPLYALARSTVGRGGENELQRLCNRVVAALCSSAAAMGRASSPFADTHPPHTDTHAGDGSRIMSAGPSSSHANSGRGDTEADVCAWREAFGELTYVLAGAASVLAPQEASV